MVIHGVRTCIPPLYYLHPAERPKWAIFRKRDIMAVMREVKSQQVGNDYLE